MFYAKDKRKQNGFILKELDSGLKYPHHGKLGKCRFEIIEKSDAGGYERKTMKFPILGQLPREGKRWQIGEDKARELEKNNRIEIVDGIVKRAVYPEDELDKRKFAPFWSHLPANLFGTAQSGKDLLNEILERAVGFDTVKPPQLIEELISHFNENAIILDSFAGSGTTAQAVLNLNKQDGGNRKFILIEMEDYAETITAERVKRVIKGYGTTEGTGGNFDFYKLGQPMFLEDGNLNELVGEEKIRQYVYYTETKTPLPLTNDDLGLTNETENRKSKIVNPKSYLGKHNDTAYYFHYEQDEVTTLDHAFLATMKTKAEQYVIYADNCLLTKDFMTKHNIIFKKIPRDITRF
jgi:adenine-specific DNA-methyltransferase